MNRKWIVAHRGDHSHAHENTLAAFGAAIACGADMIEFDVRRTADGEFVVHHDADLGGVPISQMRFTDIENWRNYPVPRLAEVLDLASGRIRIDVELKESGYEREVLREMEVRGFSRGECVITSFHASSVRALVGHAKCGLLVEQMSWDEALAAYREVGADFLAPHYRIAGAPSEVPILPWTVNDPAAIRAFFERSDVFGVITDIP
jgi:glycerophosphoryl diester phosphodiesterase